MKRTWWPAAVAALVVVGLWGSVPRASANHCTTPPLLKAVTINQGLGGYARLARGKEALVRFYLALPSTRCGSGGTAGNVTAIKINSASLAVKNGNTVLTPTGGIPAQADAIGAQVVSTSIANDHPSSPKFVVPGSILSPSTTGTWTATFEATIKYQTKNTRDTVFGPETTLVLTRIDGTSTAITKPVDRQTKALRVLAVPMGGPLSATANAAMQNGFTALSRLFPVPDGTPAGARTGPITGTSGGLRYTLNAGYVDLTGLLTNGLFCGSASNLSAVQSQLQDFRTDWDLANPDASHADRAVGFIGPENSVGAGSQACAEGYAFVNGTEAWARAVPDAAQPSKTGPITALEICHTFGCVSPAAVNFDGAYHSIFTNADNQPGDAERGYNVLDRRYLPDDHTATNVVDPYTNANTLMERSDWSLIQCKLGGTATTECSSPGSTGTLIGVAAGPAFALRGSTDDTPAGTLVNSYFDTGIARTAPPTASEYHLLQLQGTSVRRDDLIQVGPVQGHSGDDELEAGKDTFSAVVPFDLATTRMELWKGSPAAGVLLWSRTRNLAPVITSLTSTFAPGSTVRLTTNSSDDEHPALSPQGWIAWTQGDDPGDVRVAKLGFLGSAVTVDVEGSSGTDDPAWHPAGNRLAFVSDGVLYTVTVNISGNSAQVGTPQDIYGDSIDGPSVSHPSYSPDGTEIAFESEGEIWKINADGSGSATKLTTTGGNASEPSWSWEPGAQRIAYTLEEDIVILSSPVRRSTTRTVAALATLSVNSTGDLADAAPGNGICADSTGACTLRAAIQETNALAGPDTIQFNIPGTGVHTITPGSALPMLTETATLDGTTEDDYVAGGPPRIEIRGDSAGPNIGLRIEGANSANSIVRGLTINRFASFGIYISGAASNTRVEGNWVGLDATGTLDAGNGGGIQVLSTGNTIGGSTAAVRNVVSGNDGSAISNLGGNTTVQGNYVGTTADGLSALGNLDGITATTDGNTIGGPNSGEGNILSGSTTATGAGAGVSFSSDAGGNTVEGNLIGTDKNGTAAIPNSRRGIYVGADTGANNVIRNNTISGNSGAGIHLAGPGAIVVGNLIGTDSGGTVTLGNTFGIEASGVGHDSIIGGTSAGAGNVISGNQIGIGLGSSGNEIHGNWIGISAAGAPIPNSFDGIQIGSASNGNTIGGEAAGEPNQIRSNGRDGVRISGGTGNRLIANGIGPNGGIGIDLGGDGVTANDAGDGDTGPNNLQNFPVLTSATGGATTSVTGSLDSAPGTYRIHFFASAACTPTDREGERYLGGREVVSPPGSFSATGLLPTSAGEFVTANAIDSAGNTSEFSACEPVVTVTAGLVVNTENDVSDGTCNATHCSLREAITASNASVGTPDTITFAIPTSDFPSIAPVSGGLPTITDPVTIDATTQDPLSPTPDVELDGSNAGAVHGFNITAGSTTIKGFVIDDFGADGIHLQSAGDNTIVGNWIGTDVSGQETSPNLGDGIEMQQSDGNQIGGTTAGERNIVSASGGHGIFMFESDDNSVEGNYVGTDVDGLEDFGNTIDGIAVDGGQNNDIGPGNVTSGNTNQGVAVFTVGSALQSSGNTIAGNTVGLGAGGAPLPNGGQGVLIASGVGNVISQNSISSNGALGINLAPPNGINANDLDDPDTGPNDLQNFPVLTSAIRGASTTVSGTLNSEPTEDYTIEFFASASCDGTHGEGTRFLGDVGATTPPGEGDTSFTATGLGATSESESITATATDEDGNTSEFSACLTEGGPTEDGIYVLDPDNPAAPDTQLVSNGSEPALSPAGTLFFTRDGGLWVAEGDGTDATELASSGRWASPMGGDVAFQRFLPVGEGGQWELFLMTQRRMITVTATDEIPANLRFLYFYDCGADKHPLGNRLGDGSGTSELEFDTGGACGSGEATGTVTVIASDGIDLSVERPTTSFEVERSVPVAAIPSPQAGAAYTDDQTITLHGSAYDHEGRQLPGGSLSWTSPDGLFTGTKTGNTVVLPPAAGALNGESYTVIMTATDEDGRRSAPVTTTIVVYTDTDQDGLTDKVETVCSSMNPNDPTDAFTDTPDGDGIPAIDDIHTVGDPFTSNGPCVAAPAYEAIINFDPDELNIPSTGGTATASVEIPYRSVSQIVGSSVRISAIDGISYTQQNTGWSIKGGQGVAKFAREPLAAELVSRGVLNRAVRITISGTVAGKPFSGDGSTFVKQG